MVRFWGLAVLLAALQPAPACWGVDVRPVVLDPLLKGAHAPPTHLCLRGGELAGGGAGGAEGGVAGSTGVGGPDGGAGAAEQGQGDEEEEPATLNGCFRKAVRECNLTQAEGYLSEGADLNLAEPGTHSTVLITACFQNDLEMIDMLLAKGARPNLCDEMLMAPLHYAAAWGYDLVLERLMAAGSDPTLLNKEGLTPRDLAERRGHMYCVELLDKWLEAG